MKAGKIIVIVVLVLAVLSVIFFQTRPGKNLILGYKSYKATRDYLEGDDDENVTIDDGNVQVNVNAED